LRRLSYCPTHIHAIWTARREWRNKAIAPYEMLHSSRKDLSAFAFDGQTALEFVRSMTLPAQRATTGDP